MNGVSESMQQKKPTLVLGGTGKTGRRVAKRLTARDLPVRIGSRSGEPRFDWSDPDTWGSVLQGVGAVYITYQPDLAVPGAVEAVQLFAKAALEALALMPKLAGVLVACIDDDGMVTVTMAPPTPNMVAALSAHLQGYVSLMLGSALARPNDTEKAGKKLVEP